VKTIKQSAGFSVALFATLSVHAQTFQNLNFEQAHPSPGVPGPASAASALPSWTVYYGNIQQTQVIYDGESTGATQVSLIGIGAEPFLYPLDGNYSVFLTGSPEASAASISQTGLIPAGDQSLFFEAEQVTGPGVLDISIGGQNVPIVAVGTEAAYTLYAANISAWANDPEPLTFSAPAISGGLNGWEIDDISFSTTPTPEPEPSVAALTAVGGLLFGARKWFARR
jgi:hypothetical protein